MVAAAFNPKDHLSNLKGKDYLEVKWRLVWFRQEHPDWGIHAEIVRFDERLAVVKATITNAAGLVLAQGHKQEQPQHFGDYLEKAETGAIGRALGTLGYGTQFAPEFEEGDRIVDSPVHPARPAAAPKAPAVAPAGPGATVPTSPAPTAAASTERDWRNVALSKAMGGGLQFTCAGCRETFSTGLGKNSAVLPARAWLDELDGAGYRQPFCRPCAIKPANKPQREVAHG